MRIRVIVGIAVVFCAAGLVVAAPRGTMHADKAVRGWLRQSQGKPMAATLGEDTRRVETFKDDRGEPLYYIVYLEPQGYVIVPADDEVEPIIGFSPDGVYDPSPLNPMGSLVSADMTNRVAAARSQKHSRANPEHQPFFKANSRWQLLESVGDATVSPPTSHVASVSDVRVAPMILSRWSQSQECSNNCYNIYTPNNDVCGCVATAVAQLMRFYQYPARPSTTGPFSITVDDVTQTRSLRGGDGSGGNYAWSSMVLDPDCTTTLTQRQAIEALTYDAGVAVHMMYTSGSSGAWMNDARDAMVNVFSYSNVIHGGPYHSNGNITGSSLSTMINPNLDAGLPCILAIYGDGGHAVVCDGYGYSGSTLYHHLNLGWAGSADAWYNLPGIDAGSYNFDVVSICLYNIYVTGGGEVISGRVLDRDGVALSDATVTATISGGNTYTTTSNAKGIYAFSRIPSSTVYTMQASKPGYNFFPTSIATGSSVNYQNTSGNKWSVDFVQPANGAGVLTDVTVTPLKGSTCNEYHFSVHYYDVEGDAPVASQGTLTLRGAATASITMYLESGTPTNGTYGGSARLDSGAYGFQISFNDTAGMTAITQWRGGPYVSLCSDMNGDGLVNMIEFADLAARWMGQGCTEGNSWCSNTDMNHSGQVGSDDLLYVAFDWMTPPVAGSPDFALVPAGTFRMGDVADMANAAELPVHNVTLDSFIVGRYEVTNAQYCQALNWANAAGLVTVVNGIVKGVGNNLSYCNTTTFSAYSRIVWNGSVFSVTAGKEDHPMVMVMWPGAAAYCNWRSEMESLQPCYDVSTWACNLANSGYRLPTEAEWEYAARGGLDGLRYPWGSTIVGAQVNYTASGDPYQVNPLPYTTPVGFYDGSLRYKVDFNWPGAATSYQTTSGMNGYQMFDVAGNVNEMCNDWYSGTYYLTRPDPDVNPTGPSTATAAGRVIRSGSWNLSTNYSRVSQRDATPTTMAAHTIGFRIVRNAD